MRLLLGDELKRWVKFEPWGMWISLCIGKPQNIPASSSWSSMARNSSFFSPSSFDLSRPKTKIFQLFFPLLYPRDAFAPVCGFFFVILFNMHQCWSSYWKHWKSIANEFVLNHSRWIVYESFILVLWIPSSHKTQWTWRWQKHTTRRRSIPFRWWASHIVIPFGWLKISNKLLWFRFILFCGFCFVLVGHHFSIGKLRLCSSVKSMKKTTMELVLGNVILYWFPHSCLVRFSRLT